jgi:hypothetical protein
MVKFMDLSDTTRERHGEERGERAAHLLFSREYLEMRWTCFLFAGIQQVPEGAIMQNRVFTPFLLRF